MAKQIPVVVVGGGLCGMMLALELHALRVPVVVLEKRASPSTHPRARHFTTPSVQRFLALELGITGQPRPSINTGMVAGTTLADAVPLPPEPAMPPAPVAPLDIGQDRLEPLLQAAARSRGIDVRLEHEVVAIADHGVTLANGERLDARYVAVADGARSRMRAALGIDTPGAVVLGDVLSAVVRADLTGAPPFRFAVITHPEVRGYIASTDDSDRWLLGMTHETWHNTPERIRAAFAAACGANVSVAVESVATWEMAKRVAERFRLGDVFLLGDAAHQVPPAGGSGANLGIADAAALAPLLARALAGDAAALDGYHEQRWPLAQAAASRAVERAKALCRQVGAPYVS